MSKGRRIVRTVLISIGAVVGLLVLLIAACLVYQSIDKEDSFVLVNVEFQDAGYLRGLDSIKRPKIVRREDELFPVFAHRLKRGSGTIFAWRFYSNGELMTIDDEDYRKITVWIAGAPPSSPTTISLGDESKVILIFSRGGSAWPDIECCGYGTSGTITIIPDGRRFTIAINGQVTAVGTRNKQCASETVNRTFKAKEIAFESLTPWLGIAGQPDIPTKRLTGNYSRQIGLSATLHLREQIRPRVFDVFVDCLRGRALDDRPGGATAYAG
jgi:hypothetical protein